MNLTPVLTTKGFVGRPDPEGYSLVYSEYEGGDFVRSFHISNGIHRDKIEATVGNGELHLHLPIAEAAMAKRIEVKAR